MGSLMPTTAQMPWIRTPLVESTILSKEAGCRVFLKLENLQPSASFKSRGIGNLILRAIEAHPNTPLHFYCSSGGNAGLACVAACATLGYKSTICVPVTTEAATVVKLEAAGAQRVIVHGSSWIEADAHLRNNLMSAASTFGETAIYVAPFDHPDLWEGASTIVDELADQMPDNAQPDAIICSVGGGGLFTGLMQGLDTHGWSSPSPSSNQTRIVAVETAGADSLAQSIATKQHITLPKITSIATSLGAVRVAEEAYKQGLRPHVVPVVIEDAEAVASAWRFADDERMLAEPACAASVAMLYDGRLQRYLKGFGPESKVVVIYCGGSRVSLRALEQWKEEFGARAKELGLSRC